MEDYPLGEGWDNQFDWHYSTPRHTDLGLGASLTRSARAPALKCEPKNTRQRYPRVIFVHRANIY